MAERTLETCQCEASFSVSVDEHGLSFGAPTGADGLLARLRWQAFEAARLLRPDPRVKKQLRDALELLPAMQRWSENPVLCGHVSHVVVLACGEARNPREAIALAESVFSFLLTGEAAPPAADGP